jgi:hypothetical protein
MHSSTAASFLAEGRLAVLECREGTPVRHLMVKLEIVAFAPLVIRPKNGLLTPEMMTQMVDSNPMLKTLVDSNPQMKMLLSNPQLMKQMVSSLSQSTPLPT